MIRLHFPLILIVVACCGCESPNDDSSVNSKSADNETNKLTTTASQKADTPVGAHNKETGTGRNTTPSDDKEQYISFPAAGVRLVRPLGFDDAESFHGFGQPSTQSSVMVVMIPGPFSEIAAGFTTERLKTQGMTLVSKRDIEINGNTGVLMGATQTANRTEFAKWIVAFGNEKETKMITATFPTAHKDKLSAHLKSVVLGARIDQSARPAPGADVGFTIAASDKLKLTQGVGKSIFYTKDGVTPIKSPEDPMFVAAPSLSKVPILDPQRFAVRRIYQITPNTKISSIIANNAITIDGLDGYEIEAEAEDAKTGTPLVVYQVMLFDEGAYLLMVGIVGAKVSAEYLPEFKSMARSLTRKQK
ncbi:MAG: hypothetical protein HOL01_10750 [Planctomycetaceae bacterium]|jgi:hypothetical protein|nr:hypothetical protein [Planctomycetaceae bacterium]MBT6484198.1 hypothetical protein [Planctomycetaceae bacterium]MBT6495017.1 hypothetical protein [Planctomycetaceae bacterium]